MVLVLSPVLRRTSARRSKRGGCEATPDLREEDMVLT